MEKAEEIVANYKSGGVAFELAKFITNWEKQVEDMTSPLAAPTLPYLIHQSSECLFL